MSILVSIKAISKNMNDCMRDFTQNFLSSTAVITFAEFAIISMLRALSISVTFAPIIVA